jgi:hypothetical protein
MSAKIYTIFFTLLFFINTSIFANPTYRMSIEEIEVLSSTKIQASVYMENIGENVVLTSYQCALSINQSLDLASLSLKYVEESSELLNEPDLYVGIDNIDGPSELTFVSYIGSDIISKKTLVGKFTLEGNIDISSINLLDIQWNFEGTISTIITGKGFDNITDPAAHLSIFPSKEEPLAIAKVNIVGSEASEVYGDKFTDTMLYDGITSSSNGGEYSSGDDGRWAVSGFPHWVTIDLGEETYIDNIKLDPYGSDKGISYDCEFYTGKNDNKTLISKETTQTGKYWSEHSMGGITTRYITMVVTGSDGNSWCDFWEIEIYGHNSTDVQEEEEVLAEETIPSEFGISQNYPNPFNPTTNVKVMMKESGSAVLNVFNLLGEKVASVLDEELSAGEHVVSIDGSRLASGMYIYQLIVDNKFTQVKRMNLIK